MNNNILRIQLLDVVFVKIFLGLLVKILTKQKYIITILCLSIATLTFSQEVKTVEASKALTDKTQTFFKTYFSQIKAQNWSGLIDHMPDGFLELMPKESLVTQMSQAFNNEAFTTSFNQMTYNKISEAFIYEDVTYANVDYTNSFTFHFIQTDKQSDDEFETYVAFMASAFTKQFKGQNVERKGKDITISGEKVILVIDDPKVGALKMLELEKNMAEFYKMFIPAVVVDKLME